MELTYKEMVDGINEGILDEVRFSVRGYAHYGNCVLRRVYVNSMGISSFECIELLLTKDGSERSLYHGPFKDKEKVFNIKGKGRFTLREIYKNVEILEIKRHE